MTKTGLKTPLVDRLFRKFGQLQRIAALWARSVQISPLPFVRLENSRPSQNSIGPFFQFGGAQ